jgi:hypothetical protein
LYTVYTTQAEFITLIENLEPKSFVDLRFLKFLKFELAHSSCAPI